VLGEGTNVPGLGDATLAPPCAVALAVAFAVTLRAGIAVVVSCTAGAGVVGTVGAVVVSCTAGAGVVGAVVVAFVAFVALLTAETFAAAGRLVVYMGRNGV